MDVAESVEALERRIDELRTAVREAVAAGDKSAARALRAELRRAEHDWDDALDDLAESVSTTTPTQLPRQGTPRPAGPLLPIRSRCTTRSRCCLCRRRRSSSSRSTVRSSAVRSPGAAHEHAARRGAVLPLRTIRPALLPLRRTHRRAALARTGAGGHLHLAAGGAPGVLI